MEQLTEAFRDLFGSLREAGYAWEAQSPERLRKYRESAGAFDPFTRCYGLGLPVADHELGALARQSIQPAVSRWKDLFIPHSHWMDDASLGEDYVYASAESFELARELERNVEELRGKKVLDLGSGAGVLSFAVSEHASEVLGVESSAESVRWSSAAARAQDLTSVRFVRAAIGSPKAESLARGAPWDVAVFNPPMAIPAPAGGRPYRDGGEWGLELPLRFLDFSSRHLKDQGVVFCLATNPIVAGKGLFFERLPKRLWSLRDKRCLDDHFNHRLYRKEGHPTLERVELWLLALELRR